MGEICEICKNESRIIAIEKDAERNSLQHKEFYEAVKDGAVQQMKNETVYNQIFATLSDIKSDINELKATPKNRWENFMNGIVAATVGIVAGVLAGAIFKGGF